MAPGPRMRTTLTRAGGAAAPVVAPYVSAASPRRAARLSRGFSRVAPPCRRLGPGGCGLRAGQRGLGLAGRALAGLPFYGEASRPEARTRGGSPTWRVPPAPPGLSPALTLPDPELEA